MGTSWDSLVEKPLAIRFRSGMPVGPYELVRLVGCGGMTEVWLARRVDGASEREVALKLPASFHLRGDLARRFSRERDFLAGLEHPGIARFYDAGVSADGEPYFAMEYVSGKTITDSCDAARLAISEKLRLFLQVLEAVQYAHEHGVLHGNIKPSNVLVTESGQVRLLDFAVMFQHADAALTLRHERVLTPAYSSPEEIRDTDAELGPASDVYSLGVLLYELLCGRRPYQLEAGELLAHVLAVERASTRAAIESTLSRMQALAHLTYTLRRDLEAILLKALAFEAGQRYSSAQAMAADLRPYLERRP
jgi:serine/threonine protein kinase